MLVSQIGPVVSFPLVPLPVVQNWDCHATGSCCKEHHVNLTKEELRRIEARELASVPFPRHAEPIK